MGTTMAEAPRRSRGRHRAPVRAWRTLVLVPAVAILATAGTAMAYWTTSGAGTAQTNTTNAQAVTLTPGTPTVQLYPGGVADVVLTAINPNAFNVHFASLGLDTSQGSSGFGVDSGHNGCGLAVLSFTTQTNGGTGWTVPPRVNATNGTLAITLTHALSMGSAALGVCQDATFTVYLAAS